MKGENRMITSNFDERTGIFYVEMTGNIKLDEMLDHVSTKESRQYLPKKLKLLTDARHSVFTIDPNGLKLIKNEMQNTLKKYDRIVDAFLVENTKDTAISVLYMEMARIENYIFKVFNTEEAALRWLSNY